MKNILFYKYVEIEDPENFKEKHLELCKELNLKGKVLVAKEGINGCLSGEDKDCQTYMDKMHDDIRFKDLEFKQGIAKDYTFKRTLVKVRKEIVTSHLDVDMTDKADYIEPIDLKEKLDKGEDIILVDARNDYEFDAGKFENAIQPGIDIFSDFPKLVKSLEKNKDKQIVTYCTGGIRCEKAATYMKQQGFSNVKQLHGGIIRYGDVVGDAHWEGKCFVFDRRGAVEIDPEKQETEYDQCITCFIPCESKHTCKHCKKEYIACKTCFPLFKNTCSKFCRNKL